MAYICPTCKRKLPSLNQHYSCYVTDKNVHVAKMSTEIEALFEILLSHLHVFEEI